MSARKGKSELARDRGRSLPDMYGKTCSCDHSARVAGFFALAGAAVCTKIAALFLHERVAARKTVPPRAILDRRRFLFVIPTHRVFARRLLHAGAAGAASFARTARKRRPESTLSEFFGGRRRLRSKASTPFRFNFLMRIQRSTNEVWRCYIGRDIAYRR